MRLLGKKDVDKAKAVEQRQAIDEGLKLAKRIDGLRETASLEEAALSKFRRETLSAINEEIKQKTYERDVLHGEVIVLQREKEEAKRPLTQEWEQVKEATAKVNKERKDLDKEKAELATEREALSNATRDVERATARVNLRIEAANRLLSDVASKDEASSEALKRATEIEARTKEQAEKVQKELIHRGKELTKRETDVTMREANLTDREIELAKGWKLLHDRQAMLERTLTRTNNKKHGN